MGKRNMEKIAEKVSKLMLTTKYLSAYSMDIDEMCKLHEMCLSDKDIEACSLAFDYGFAMGTRAREKQRTPVI